MTYWNEHKFFSQQCSEKLCGHLFNAAAAHPSEKLDVCGTITIFIADIELIFKSILESIVSKRYLITFLSEAGWSMQEDQKDGCPCWFFQNTHHYVLVFVLSKTPITICLYLYCPKHPSLCRICVFVNTLFTIHLHLYFPKHTSQQYFPSVCRTINYSSKLLSSHRSFPICRSLRLYYVPIGITMWYSGDLNISL